MAAFEGTISRLASSNREEAVARKKAKDAKDKAGVSAEGGAELGAKARELTEGDKKEGDKVGAVDTKALKKTKLTDIGQGATAIA